MVLTDHEPNPWVEFREKKRVGRNLKVPVRANASFPELLHVSARIRDEALPIFLSNLKVYVNAALYMSISTMRVKDQLPLVKGWIFGLGKDKAKMIKSFELKVDNVGWGSVPQSSRYQLTYPALTGEKAAIFENLGMNDLGLVPGTMALVLKSFWGVVSYDEDGNIVR